MATTNTNLRLRDERVALHSFAPMLHDETVEDAKRVLGDEHYALALRSGALYVDGDRVVSPHA